MSKFYQILKKLIILAIIPFSSFCQNLTIKNLLHLQGKELEYTHPYLIDKGWDFHNSEKINKNRSNEDEDDNYDVSDDKLSNYSAVVWSYNENQDERAESWFFRYVYEGFETAIGYQTIDKKYFNKLRRYAESVGFKLVKTISPNGEIKSIYRKGKLEVFFTTSKNSDRYQKNYYTIYVYNFAEVEIIRKRKEEQELLAIEEQLKLEENQRQLEEQQKRVKARYNELIEKADIQFKSKKYQLAKNLYETALQLNVEDSYPRNKIIEVDEILAFLEERKSKVYNYPAFDNFTYTYISSQIIQKVKQSTIDNELNGKISSTLTYNIDSLGKNNLTYKNDINSSEIFFNKI